MNCFICLFLGDMWYTFPQVTSAAYGVITAEEFFNNPESYPALFASGLYPSDVDIAGETDPNYFGVLN